ncbi:MAG: DNA internalization-related competence protein ComEC/Rec2 [Thermodesulfobacteriota bacterium]
MASQTDPSKYASGRLQPGIFYQLPVLPLLLAYTAGLIPARFIQIGSPARIILWSVLILSALRVLYLFSRNKSACISPLVLFFSLGIAAVSFWQPCNFPPESAAALLDSGEMQVRGTIAKPPESEPRRTVCILEDLEISPEGRETRSVPGRLRAAFYGGSPGFSAGDRILMQGSIRGVKNFNNPGGFNYRQYMADRNIWGTVYAGTHDIESIKKSSSALASMRHAVHRFRSRLDSAVQKAGSGESAAVLSALVVGKRDRINPELREAFNGAGAGHLLAISGLHVGIVAACSFAVFKWFFSRSQSFLLRGWTVRSAALLTILPVAAYAMISGMSPSTQRAAVMATVFLAAFILEKPYNPANTIAAAALFLLSVYPPALFSISFQLSFAAVSAIIFGIHIFSPIRAFLHGSETQGHLLKYLKRIAAFSMISVFAIAGTTPLVMHYFNQAAPAAVISNLILVPWIGFVVVPAGLISALFFRFSQTAGTWCLAAADSILNPAVDLIRAIADIPFGSFKTVTPTWAEVILIYLILICAGLAAARGLKDRSRLLKILLIIVIAAALADGAYWVHRRFFHQDLRITVMDVGQGHASIVELPGGETMLIDGGGFPDNKIFDAGRYIVAPCLRAKKIGTLDRVVLSHPDSDHLNGLLYVLENFRVKKVIKGPAEGRTESWGRFLKILEKGEIKSPDFENTGHRLKVNKAEIRLLHPQPDGGNYSDKCKGTNNQSIVLRLEFMGRSVLFPGDIEKCAESELIYRSGKTAASDVLIAPHHASKTSSGKQFLKTVDPDTVVVPARKSSSGPPSEKVLKRYKQKGCRVMRTDKHGAVRIRVSREGKISVEPAIKTNMAER